VIGRFGTDFANSHYLITINTYWVFEAVAIPELEQGHIQTYVCWIERFIDCNLLEKSC
jgi:hypothetical protein